MPSAAGSTVTDGASTGSALGLGVPVAAASSTVDTGDGHREGHVCRGDLVRAPWGTPVQVQRQRHQPEPVVDPVAPGQRVDLAVQRHRRGGERVPQSGRALHHGGGGRPDRQRAVRLPPDGDGAVGEGQSGDVRARIQPSGEPAPGAVLEPAAEQVTCHVAVDRDQGRRSVRRAGVAADGHRLVDHRRDGRGLPVDRGEHGRRVGLGRRRGHGEAQVGADPQVGLVDLRALPGGAEPEPERRRRDRGRDQHHGRARVRTPGRLLDRQRQHQARRAKGQPGGGAQQHRHQPHHDQGAGDHADHRREGERDVHAVGGRGRLAAQLPPGQRRPPPRPQPSGSSRRRCGPSPSGAGWPRTWCSCRRRSAPAPERAPGCSRARSAPARR